MSDIQAALESRDRDKILQMRVSMVKHLETLATLENLEDFCAVIPDTAWKYQMLSHHYFEVLMQYALLAATDS